MRYIKQGVARDGYGKIIPLATISVYLATTTTPVSIYATSSGGAAINSVTCDSSGTFIFYIDDSDYSSSTLFKITISKDNYSTQTWDNVVLMASVSFATSAEILAGTETNKSIAPDQLALANIVPHPTGDGNQHVPANSTTNLGKVLTSSAVAGTYTWEEKVSDTAYDATSWDGVTDIAPSKHAIRDKIESLDTGGGGGNFSNLSLTVTPSSGSLVIAMKTEAGTDPSANDKASVKYISETLTDTIPVTVDTTSAVGLTLPSGGTLGNSIVYASQYPVEQNGTYVKSTTNNGGDALPYFTTDPSKPLLDLSTNNQWYSANGSYANQRFHIDLGSSKIITRIYFENSHSSGGSTNRGVNNFTIQGTDNAAAFAELTYATNTNWTDITASISHLEQHVAANTADPQYCTLTNTTAYRYYAIKCADCYGSGDVMGLRRVELQQSIIPPIRAYIWGLNNAGSNAIGLSRTADIFPESNLVTTTAIGTGSDSASVMYSTDQLTSKACRCLGYFEANTSGVEGYWTTVSKVVLMHNGIKRTGDIIKETKVYSGATIATAAANIPIDGTIPQITEGIEVYSFSATPTSISNLMIISYEIWAYGRGGHFTAALFRDGAASAVRSSCIYVGSAEMFYIRGDYQYISASLSAEAFTIRIGDHNSNTQFINADSSSNNLFGGTLSSGYEITEVMA